MKSIQLPFINDKRNMSTPQEPKKDEDLKEVLSENEKLKRDVASTTAL